MSYIKILVIFMVFASTYAIPRCTFSSEDKTGFECVPNDEDSDFALERGLVSDKPTIKSLTINNCKISTVDCQAFLGLTNLNSLDLSGNSMKSLMPCVLQGLHTLLSLNLSYNRISEMRIGFFDAAYSIEVLDLKGNNANTIQSGVFDKIINLKELDLSINAFKGKELDKHLFEHNRQLKSLDFSRNDMSETKDDLLSELPILQSLTLDRCFLSEFPPFIRRPNLRTLKVLILSTNQISNLNDPTLFVNLDDLEILNLSNNAIESIAENVFAPLRKVKTIVLKKNRMMLLPEKLFQNMPKLISIDISYNLIEKIQLSHFRNTPCKNLNISGNKLTYLPENFCQRLRDAGGRLKKLLFTPNPWQCPCFRELMSEVTSLGLEYSSARFDGKTSVCTLWGDNLTCVRD